MELNLIGPHITPLSDPSSLWRLRGGSLFVEWTLPIPRVSARSNCWFSLVGIKWGRFHRDWNFNKSHVSACGFSICTEESARVLPKSLPTPSWVWVGIGFPSSGSWLSAVRLSAGCWCVHFDFCSFRAPPLTSEAVGTCDTYLTSKKELPFFVWQAQNFKWLSTRAFWMFFWISWSSLR